MKRTLMLLTVLLLALGLAAIAQATTTTTHAEYYWDSSPAISDSDDDSGTGEVSSRVAYPDPPPWDGILGYAAGNDADRIAAKAWYIGASGGMNHSAKASVTGTNVFTAHSSGNYTWDFTIQDGELRIYDWCYGPEMTAKYNIEISLDGTVLWSSSAELFGGMPGYTYTVSGTDMGGTPFGISPNIDNEFGYAYDTYNGSVDLGYFNHGDQISLSCLLEVETGGPGFETGSSAFFGDPGDLGGGGIHGNLVPEPATICLLGLGGLGLLRRRKSA